MHHSSLLLKAISKGDSIEVIRDIVDQYPSSVLQMDGRPTPLMNAAKYGHAAVAQFLINYGCSVNDIDKTGKTALGIAVNHGHLEIIKSLIAAKADVNHQDSQGMTPLMTCAQSGRIVIIDLLLLHGADQNISRKDLKKAIDLTSSSDVRRVLSQSLNSSQYYEAILGHGMGNVLRGIRFSFPSGKQKCLRHVSIDENKARFQYDERLVNDSVDTIMPNRSYGSNSFSSDGGDISSSTKINCSNCSNKSVITSASCLTYDNPNTSTDTDKKNISLILKCSTRMEIIQKELSVLTYLHNKYLEKRVNDEKDEKERVGRWKENEEVVAEAEKESEYSFCTYPFIQNAFKNNEIICFRNVLSQSLDLKQIPVILMKVDKDFIIVDKADEIKNGIINGKNSENDQNSEITTKITSNNSNDYNERNGMKNMDFNVIENIPRKVDINNENIIDNSYLNNDNSNYIDKSDSIDINIDNDSNNNNDNNNNNNNNNNYDNNNNNNNNNNNINSNNNNNNNFNNNNNYNSNNNNNNNNDNDNNISKPTIPTYLLS